MISGHYFIFGLQFFVLWIVLTTSAFAQQVSQTSKDDYRSQCEAYMKQRMDHVTAMRLCECRSSLLTSAMDTQTYKMLIQDQHVDLKLSREHAKNIVAPCQYLAFQSEILNHCTKASAFSVYRNQNPRFCLCYAHERSIYMKYEMPKLISDILDEHSDTHDPFSMLYDHPRYNDRIQGDISSCLK